MKDGNMMIKNYVMIIMFRNFKDIFNVILRGEKYYEFYYILVVIDNDSYICKEKFFF